MQAPLRLIIVGRGKMAQMMERECARGFDASGVLGYQRVDGVPFPLNFPRESIVVHVSSKERLPGVVEECEKYNLPLIQASSGQTKLISKDVKIPVIDAPNLSLEIVALFDVLPRLGKLIQEAGSDVHVCESHQHTKTSPPITAHTIAGFFGKMPESVQSIRDIEVQTAILGVSGEHIGGHGYHYVKIVGEGGSEIILQTKINGRLPYFYGALAVARKILEIKATLAPGIYPIDKFMFGDVK